MRHPVRVGIVLLVFLLNAQIAVSDNLTEAKARDIDELLEITGAYKVALQYSNIFIHQLSLSLEREKPDISQRAFDIIEKEVRAVVSLELEKPMGFRNEMRYIYHKYFSHSEIQELLAFNKTPLGQKIIRITPEITREGMQAGQNWGRSLEPIIRERVLTRLKEEGILIE